MAVTKAQADAPASAKKASTEAQTTLDDDVTMPSKVEPGDGPFDTTDPLEHATSVSPDKGAAGRKGFGVVNAVVPLEQPPAGVAYEEDRGEDRIETYTVTGPNGKPVQVEHNIDTGDTKVVG